MPTKFAKGDDIRVRSDKFDGEGETDELGLKFSESSTERARLMSWVLSLVRDGCGMAMGNGVSGKLVSYSRKNLECHRNTGLGIMRER
jgi:hypothetical protein